MPSAHLRRAGFFLGMLMAPTLASAGSPETCAAPSTTAVVLGELTRAQEAFEAQEAAAFKEAVGAAEAALPCVSDPVAEALAARIHLVRGLEAWVANDFDRAKRAFAAHRALDPSGSMARGHIPADVTAGLHITFHAIPVDTLGTLPVPPVAPRKGALRFDGTTQEERPAERPTVVQVLDAQAEVDQTAYLWPGDALPPYPLAPPPSVGMSPRRKTAWWVGGTGAALLAGAGGAWGYYAYSFKAGDCRVDGQGDLQCPLASTGDTHTYYDTFLRPAQIAGFAALGAGVALSATSTILFVTSSPGGAQAGIRGTW